MWENACSLSQYANSVLSSFVFVCFVSLSSFHHRDLVAFSLYFHFPFIHSTIIQFPSFFHVFSRSSYLLFVYRINDPWMIFKNMIFFSDLKMSKGVRLKLIWTFIPDRQKPWQPFSTCSRHMVSFIPKSTTIV